MNAILLQPVQEQATKLARGNPDLAQDILAMCFSNYHRALEKGKKLSVGECVNFMKYRLSELKSGKRRSFGSPSGCSAKDVFHIGKYYSGDVKVLSLEQDEGDAEDDNKGIFEALTASNDISDQVCFEVGLKEFLEDLEQRDYEAMGMRLAGYSYKEIARSFRVDPSTIRTRLKVVGKEFIRQFELPEAYLHRYGLA